MPKGVETVALHIMCPDKREGATLQVFNPDGEKVFEETDWFHEERSIRVEAPPGHRGRVWSFVAHDPRKKGHPYAADDVIVSFSDAIPPFVSTDPTALTTVLLAAGEVGTEQLANAD